MTARAGRAETEALIDRLFREECDWPNLIKTVRGATSIGLRPAIRLVFQHEGWRRLCNHRINHDAECRKQALHELRRPGDGDPLIVMDGETLRIAKIR